MNIAMINVQGFGNHSEMEIAQKHLDQNDRVTYLICNSTLLTCESNLPHDLDRCLFCIARRNTGLSLLTQKAQRIPFLKLTKAQQKEMSTLQTTFSSLSELRAYKIENFDVGMGVLSWIVSHTRNPEPDLQIFADLIKRMIISAFAVFRSVQNHLDQHHVDRVYVHNGRRATLRAVLRACQSRNVTYVVHEDGHSIYHYGMWINASPHALAHTENEMQRQWHCAEQNPEREKIASKFFNDRIKAIPQSTPSYVTGQKSGLLPDNWDSTKKNIAIFNSSEDEFVAIGDEWRSSLYMNQLEGMRQIAASLKYFDETFHFYLRMHPNSQGMPTQYNRHFVELQSKQLTVISPSDPTSTYTLLRAANKVLTFGSSVGIEAVFWGIPSILAGPSFYQNLGGTYNPRSHEELVDLLKADIPPKSKTAALMYGYYNNSFGIPYKYYHPIDSEEGTFKGINVHRSHKWLARLMWHTRESKIKHILVTKPFLWLTQHRLTQIKSS